MTDVILDKIRVILTKLQGRVTTLSFDDGKILAVVETSADMISEEKRKETQKEMAEISGVTAATLVLTAERIAPQMPPMRPKPAPIAGVSYVIAVASGKGGVGKSTVAINLAAALARNGWRVGLLDADIYGPSQPRMAGLENAGKPELTADKKKIKPFDAFGIKVMSIGFFIEPAQAAVWRGPMIQKAIRQLTHDVEWGNLDVLIVDLPPGTGDAALTLCQMVEVTGAVIVSTPQDIALLDVRKGINMFEKLDVPVLGMIENMSFYHCPSCGHEDHIFGHGGAKSEAQKLGTAFLGEIPLALPVRAAGDAGTPVVIVNPELAASRAFVSVATELRALLSVPKAKVLC